MKSETKYSHRILAMILCIIMLFFMCDNALIALAQVFDPSTETVQQEETCEDIKARLLDQIMYDGWDPYSADMTIDEFFALMELFDDGMLPLNQVSAYALTIGAEVEEASCIPRTKFMFAGLENYVRIDGSNDNSSPLPYDDKVGSGDDYPSGLDPYDAGYMLPPTDWNGIATDDSTSRVVLVSKDVNADNNSVAGDVVQKLFAKYTGYYVKQVTIDGANINVLGMIDVGGRYIYYYLSAEDQSTQVSTTTLPDEAKFIIEYVPIEHTVSYIVQLEDGSDVTNATTPVDVVFYGKNAHQDISWADGIFGENRPNITTDGAYSFDVTVPYGYELEIHISIKMSPDIEYKSRTPQNASFPVEINHTGSKQKVHDDWLAAYCNYLISENFVANENEFYNHITEETSNGKITLKWADQNDPDKPAHDSILERMAERINDFIVHNNGYPLGAYPVYKYVTGFNIIPDSDKGPTEHTMLDTFYNHLVKANRTITAVLTKQDAPTFDVSQILQKSDGAQGRGSSATEDFAKKSLYSYDDDYEYHKNGGTRGAADDPLPHSADYPNVETADSWRWTNNNKFRSNPQNMVFDDATDTYYYSWVFQTNTDDSFYLDAFEVNGIAIQPPYYPKYNWDDSYKVSGKYEKADEEHPYYTETTLADGAILRVEFLLGWNEAQRHYRITVTGARSNVVVTGLNLMQYKNGAPEFVTYNMVGVYSDQGGYSQTDPAIEYYDIGSNKWIRKEQSNVIVYETNPLSGLDLDICDTEHYGANIRFKITEGYGSPYYSWTNRHGDVISGQASENNPTISLEDVENSEQGKGGLIGGKLDSQYIYEGNDGYYYIRVTTQKGADGTDYKIALLNIIARSVRFTVRYVPENDHEDGAAAWGGFLLHNENDKDSNNDKLFPIDAKEVKVDLESMPRFDHNPAICRLWEMAKDETGEVPEKYQQILHQYDDNGVDFYDMIAHPIATIATNTYGTVRPKSNDKNYVFVDWVVVDDNYLPVKDEDDKYIRFLGGAIDFTMYAGYAVKHVAFGNADTDIHVLRLMPVWQKIEQPYTYKIVINRVDKDGNIYADNFSEYWDDVVTAMPDDENIYVYLNKDAVQFQSWIANHPTYKFWDEVNNIADNIYQNERSGGTTRALAADPETEALNKAIYDYLGEPNDNLLSGLKNEKYYDHENNLQPANDTFKRYGNDIFVANDDDDDERGTITLWMYETKGGVIFHKDVLPESYIPNDEFYFSVNVPDDGEYTAYPEFVYDDEGNERERIYSDAMSVVFENGILQSIDGINTDHFSLKSGEGIALYGPAGTYTVAETGSKSGGLYSVEVKYLDETEKNKNTGGSVTIPAGISRISGTNTTTIDNDSVISTATVDIGESKVIGTLTYINRTTSLVIKNEVIAPKDDALWQHSFTYNLEFTLPEGETPLEDDNGYYYNIIVYQMSGNEYVVKEEQRLGMKNPAAADSQQLYIRAAADTDTVWQNENSFDLLPDEYAVIALPAPQGTGQTISYKATETKPINSEMWYLQGKKYEREGTLVTGKQTKEVYVNLPGQTSMLVSKTVVRSDGVTDTTKFTFTVKLTDENGNAARNINGTIGEVTFTGGTATFELGNGDSVWISPLPRELNYTVTETQNSAYNTNSTNATGKLVSGETAEVGFVNTYKTNNGYLVITEEGGKSNESFLYRVTDNYGNELIVSVKGSGKTVVCAPIGAYTITEISEWSWKYEDGEYAQSKNNPKGKKADVTITNENNTPENAISAKYTHVRNDKVWLGGENSKDNHFAGTSTANENQESNSPKEEVALLSIFDDKKKKHTDNDKLI